MHKMGMDYSFWGSITRWVLGLFAVFIIVLTIIGKMEPDKKVVTKIVTTQVAVPQLAISGTVPIGSMTAQEFNYITENMTMETVERMFGKPYGNPSGDFQTWYPAAGGGRYIIHDKWNDCGSDCDVLVVKSKEYQK